MDVLTPETRPIASGDLGILQQFINSGHLGSELGVAPETAEEVRLRTEAGEHQASLAKEFGLGRTLVSAMGRGAPMFDELATLEGAEEWLRGHSLLQAGEKMDERARERVVEFRELLRLLAAANAHGEANPADLAALNAVTATVPLSATFGPGPSVQLRPSKSGAEQAIGRLLIVLYDAMRDGSWRRLKRCPGSGCPFTFYDSSRNRTAVWCSMSVCGNRAKVRNYQERARTGRAKRPR